MRRRRVRRALWPFVVSVAFVGVLFLAVFPTRTYLAQRASTADARERLSILREQNEILEARAERLHSDEEIERIAREQYNLVYPGEEAYALLPPPVSTAPTTPASDDEPLPESVAAGDTDRSALQRTWEILTSWL